MKQAHWESLKCADVLRNLYAYHMLNGTEYHRGVAHGMEQTLTVYNIHIRGINAHNKAIATAHLRNKRLTADERVQALSGEAYENIYEKDIVESEYWTGVYDGVEQTLAILGKN